VWIGSPEYVTESVCKPTADGEYVTEQVAVPALPARVQVVLENVPDDAGESLKVTVPVGVILVPELVSATVAVQATELPIENGAAQFMLVELAL